MSTSEPSVTPTRKSSPLRTAISVICLLGVALGCAAQLTFRDHYPFPWSAVFYALPRPLLLVLAIAGTVVARSKWSRLFWGVTAFGLAGWVSQADIAWNPPPGTAAESEQIVFWNVGHDLPDDVEVVERLLARKPAVLGLVETGDLKDNWLALWREKHPDYQLVTTYRGLLLAVRGQVINHRRQELARSSPTLQVNAEIDGQAVRIVLVDIVANPWISRRDALTTLAGLLQTDDGRPAIVMGDFNAPDDSVWFEPLRAEFREAFRTAGQGYVPTWPRPAPVLKLDQIWVNRRVEVRRAWQQRTWQSDHNIQWASVKWETNSP